MGDLDWLEGFVWLVMVVSMVICLCGLFWRIFGDSVFVAGIIYSIESVDIVVDIAKSLVM